MDISIFRIFHSTLFTGEVLRVLLSIRNIQISHPHQKEEIVDYPAGRRRGILMQFTSHAVTLTQNGLEEVYPGDCLLSFPHTPAYIAPSDRQQEGFSNSYIIFETHEPLVEACAQYGVPHNQIIREADFNAVRALFDQLYIEKALARPLYREQTDLLLRQLLVHLGRSAARREPALGLLRNRELMGMLQNIRQEMYLNLNAYQTVQSMADAINISSGYFRSVYKSLFGITPKQDILMARIEKSKALLTITDQSMAQIAELCGFEDENYFARCFKAQLRLTPSAYRKQYRNL